MPFYTVVPSDVTPAAGEDAAFGLPGQAQMVAIRVRDLAFPAGRGPGKNCRSALVAAGAGRIRSGIWWCSSSRWRSRRRWCAATGGCRRPGIRLITSAWA